jgi:hypothetical protein
MSLAKALFCKQASSRLLEEMVAYNVSCLFVGARHIETPPKDSKETPIGTGGGAYFNFYSWTFGYLIAVSVTWK